MAVSPATLLKSTYSMLQSHLVEGRPETTTA